VRIYTNKTWTSVQTKVAFIAGHPDVVAKLTVPEARAVIYESRERYGHATYTGGHEDRAITKEKLWAYAGLSDVQRLQLERDDAGRWWAKIFRANGVYRINCDNLA
jgi:hypothetical protein